jgi:hypothetical protein
MTYLSVIPNLFRDPTGQVYHTHVDQACEVLKKVQHDFASLTYPSDFQIVPVAFSKKH